MVYLELAARLMRNFIFRLFRTIHAWGGVTLALWLLLVSTTGALLVWKQEYLRFAIPQATTAFTPTPEALAAIASAVETHFKPNDLSLIEFATADFALTKVTLVDNHYAYLDPLGRVVAEWVLNERWEEWLYDLHHRLLLGNPGLTLVGCAALAMIFLLFAGLVSFWPLRRGFRQGLWPRNLARPQLLRSHRNLGLILALPMLMTLVTGAMLAFPEQSQQLLVEPFRDDTYSLDFVEHLDGVSGGASGEWLPAMQRALRAFPGASIRSAQAPNDFSPYRIIGLQQPGEWNPQGLSKVYIDAKMGHMDVRIDSQAQHVSERLVNGGYPLHTGRIHSLPYKLLLTLSALLIATLSFLGLISFIKGRL